MSNKETKTKGKDKDSPSETPSSLSSVIGNNFNNAHSIIENNHINQIAPSIDKDPHTSGFRTIDPENNPSLKNDVNVDNNSSLNDHIVPADDNRSLNDHIVPADDNRSSNDHIIPADDNRSCSDLIVPFNFNRVLGPHHYFSGIDNRFRFISCITSIIGPHYPSLSFRLYKNPLQSKIFSSPQILGLPNISRPHSSFIQEIKEGLKEKDKNENISNDKELELLQLIREVRCNQEKQKEKLDEIILVVNSINKRVENLEDKVQKLENNFREFSKGLKEACDKINV